MEDCQDNCENCKVNKTEAIKQLNELIYREENGCWQWKKTLPAPGYGRMMFLGKVQYAHRVSYYAHKGDIPKGLELDHLCRNRSCVNPDHLEAVTHQENVRRSPIHASRVNARKEVCKHGHSLADAIIPKGNNRRYCRECNRLHCAIYNQKRRLQIKA